MKKIQLYDSIEAQGVEAVEKLGTWFAKSGMFGITAPEQGAVLAMTALAERVTPVELLKKYHLVQGRLAMRSDAMLAEFIRAGGKVTWVETSPTRAAARFVFADNDIELEFTMDEAKSAGLASRENWKKHPANMLRARLISNAVRMLAPQVCSGQYTPEEVQDTSPSGGRASFAEVAATVTTSSPIVAEATTLFEGSVNRVDTPGEAGRLEVYAKWIDDLERIIEPVEDAANKFLLDKGWLREGQNFRDLSEEQASKIISRPDAFVSAVTGGSN
tara:strand:- start:520 stop:1341 length:822 start_codon:yes stop_codon:yes gene_type:complete